MIDWSYELAFWLGVAWFLVGGTLAALFPRLYSWGYGGKLPAWAEWTHVRPVGAFALLLMGYVLYSRFVLGERIDIKGDPTHPLMIAFSIVMWLVLAFATRDAFLRYREQKWEMRQQSNRKEEYLEEKNPWNTARKR